VTPSGHSLTPPFATATALVVVVVVVPAMLAPGFWWRWLLAFTRHAFAVDDPKVPSEVLGFHPAMTVGGQLKQVEVHDDAEG